MQLDARLYTFTAWCDYVEDHNAADLHFDTTVPAQVSLYGDYHPACTRREAFCGTASADLTPYQEAQDTQDATAQYAPVHHQHIGLKRPQAKFTLLSTDTEEFLHLIQTRGYGGATARVAATAASG